MNKNDWEDLKRWCIDCIWVVPLVALGIYIACTVILP